MDLDEEEQAGRESIELLMRKYRKLFRHLFEAYANTCYTHKAKVFDTLRAKSEQINLAEFRKMLNDHRVSHVSREELTTLFRLINARKGRIDLQSLSFDGFTDCFVQLAIYLHNRCGKATACVPLVEAVRTLLAAFAAAAPHIGESGVLYTDPEAATLLSEDQELLRELNTMIEKSPNYPLPEGYKKVQEKEIRYVHRLGSSRVFNSYPSIKVAVEILDEILDQALGMHFVEPMPKTEYVTRVRPDALKVSTTIPTVRPSRYLDLAGGKPRTNRLAQLEDTRRSKPELAYSYLPRPKPKPKVSIATKLVIAALPRDLRDIGLEVGAVVEEIVQAVENGKTQIRNNATGERVNRAMRERQEMLEETLRAERDKETRRRQHQQLLKQKLEEKKSRQSKEPVSATPPAESVPDPSQTQTAPAEKKRQDKERLEEIGRRFEERAEKKREEKLKAEQEKKTKLKEEKEKRQKELEPFIKKKKEEFVWT